MKTVCCLAGLWVVVLLTCMGANPTQAQPAMVYLGPSVRPDHVVPGTGQEATGNRLAAEFARQSVLIGLRDELGYLTRDAALFEPMPEEPSDPGLIHCKIHPLDDGPTLVVLQHGREVILEYEIENTWGSGGENARAVVNGETFSREVVPEALRAAGFEGEAVQWHDAADVPEDIRELMGELNALNQFRAARALHGLIREDGESPERLAALSMTYANLGQLTEFYARSQPKVFRARALLYAQRLIQKLPEDDRRGLDARAYAWMMAGFCRLAGRDGWLANRTGQERTELCNLVFTYNRADLLTLEAIAADPDHEFAQIAGLLQVRLVEWSKMTAQTFNTIFEASEANPACIRLLHGGYYQAGVSAGHRITEMAPALFHSYLAWSGPRLADLPEPVAELLGQMPRREWQLADAAAFGWAMIMSERESPEPHELSYAALGEMISDTNFMHVMQRALFMQEMWGVSTVDFLRESSPYIRNHPYVLWLVVLAYDRRAVNETLRRALSEVELGDMNILGIRPLFNHMSSELAFANMTWQEGWFAVQDYQMRDDAEVIRDILSNQGNERGISLTQWMGHRSPKHPVRIAQLVRWTDLSEDDLAEYAEQYVEHAAVMRAFYSRAMAEDDFETARYYARLMAGRSPSYWTLSRLAQLELWQGDEEAWLAALEKVLEQPSYGLDHSMAYIAIAQTLMSWGQYEEALPYSEEASEAYSWKALNNYAWNLYAVGRHEDAAEVFHAMNVRYGGRHWLNFCVRMGMKDQAAEAWAANEEALRADAEDSGPSHYPRNHYYMLLAIGQRDTALREIRAMVDSHEYPVYSRELINGVLLADELGQIEQRDAWLAMLRDYPLEDGQRVRLSLLGDLFAEVYAGGAVDLGSLEAWMDVHDDGDRGQAYLLAWFLHNREGFDPEVVEAYLLEEVAEASLSDHIAGMACRQLERRGVELPMLALPSGDAHTRTPPE